MIFHENRQIPLNQICTESRFWSQDALRQLRVGEILDIMGEESIDEAGQAVAGLVNMVMICYPLDPSGKLT